MDNTLAGQMAAAVDAAKQRADAARVEADRLESAFGAWLGAELLRLAVGDHFAVQYSTQRHIMRVLSFIPYRNNDGQYLTAARVVRVNGRTGEPFGETWPFRFDYYTKRGEWYKVEMRDGVWVAVDDVGATGQG